MKQETDILIVYADGSFSSRNQNTIGAASLFFTCDKLILSTSYFSSNRALNSVVSELYAFLHALYVVKLSLNQQRAIFYLDCEYIVRVFNKVYTAKCDQHHHIWGEIFLLAQQMHITCRWIKAHQQNKYNNFCDVMAKIACDFKLATFMVLHRDLDLGKAQNHICHKHTQSTILAA